MALMAGSALVFTACSDGDKVFDEIQANVERGAVLRTVSVTSNEVAINADGTIAEGANFGVILEEQDQEGGDLLDFVEVYVGYRDNTAGGTDNDRDEVLAETITSDAFTIGEFGLPRTEYSISGDAMLSAIGLSSSLVEGGDQFTIRFELVLTDGRRYSFADNSGTLTGSFFSSPFLYTANVVCAPAPPTAGTWTVEMADAFEDGWNGASLTITIDGEASEFLVDATEASASTETFEVPADAEVISIQFNSGSFDAEISYTITSASGNVIVEQEAYSDSDPQAGVELINYCIVNY